MIKKILPVLLVLWTAVSCDTGLTTQMNEVLDGIEADLGYVNSHSDDEIARMADWFERHSDDSRKARALYCLGRNQYNSRHYSSAIVTYTRALEYAESAADTLTSARICYDMAHTCNASGNTTDEIIYLARAAEAFKAAGRESESQKALLEIGQAQASTGKTAAAEEIFKSVLYDSHELRDTLLEVRSLEMYAALAVSKDTLDPVLAIELLGRAADDLDFPLTCEDKGILAYAYSLIGKNSEAKKWLAEAKSAVENDEQAAGINFREYQIAARSGDSATALAALEKVLEYGNAAQTASLEEAVATSQREYIEEQAAAQAEKLRSARLQLWVLALGSVLALVAAFLIFNAYREKEKQRLAAEKADTEKYMGIAEDLQARLAAVSARVSEEEQASHKEASSQSQVALVNFDAFERLCEQYYIYEGTENLQPKILSEVKSIVEGLRSDKKTRRGLEKILDKNMDGVMTKLRAEYPSWKEEDCMLYAFAAAGFSSTTISALMGREKSVIYTRIWRLKGRISASDSPLKDFFLSCLEK